MRKSLLILIATLGAALLGGGWVASLYLGGPFGLMGSAMIVAGAILIAGAQISSTIADSKGTSGRI